MFPVKDEYSGPMDFLEVGYGEGEPPDKPLVTHDEQRKKNVNAKAKCEQCGEEFQFSFQAWLPDGYSQFFRLYVFGPSGFWTMAPLRCAAKFDPFLSLDCARVEDSSQKQKRD